MRRLLVVTLVLFAAAALFADDALVLPQGVWRARVAGAYTMADKAFDDSSKRVDASDTLTTFNIGAALEYGIIPGVNLAAQWIPGYIVSSTLDTADKAHVAGAFDLFLGGKVQILGDDPVTTMKNDTMRFAAAAGVVVPLPGPDFKQAAKDALAGDDFALASADRHVFGLGGRAYFDYVFVKDQGGLAEPGEAPDMFYVNLYSEFIKYLKRDVKFLDFTPAPTELEAEFDFGYQLTLEAEPHFEKWMTPKKLQLKAGIPVTYVMTPEVKVDGTGQNDEGYSLNIRPWVAAFVVGVIPMPFEVEVGYMYPLAGKNVSFANSAVTFQLKTFFKF